MFNPADAMMRDCIKRLQVGYRYTYGNRKPAYAELIGQVATMTLGAIAHSDALYHNLEHTILVTLVGQEILRGKQHREGNVSCRDWAHFIISLLCHDIGYLKGICRQDNPALRTYDTGMGELVVLPPGATDASLTPHHVDRGKRFISETFADQPLLDLAVLQYNIELTRFPVPKEAPYQETANDAGLARAADLIGQLSDPRYLDKIPALFYEFAEVGTNRALGYQHPGDLRSSYPTFFNQVVFPYIQSALSYLTATRKGRQALTNLYAHVATVERECQTPARSEAMLEARSEVSSTGAKTALSLPNTAKLVLPEACTLSFFRGVVEHCHG